MTEEKAKGRTEETKGQTKETEERATETTKEFGSQKTRETTGGITGEATEVVAGLTGQATESLGSDAVKKERQGEKKKRRSKIKRDWVNKRTEYAYTQPSDV